MTRKRSNVKALALAVTCAILAGGYSGLNPVHAAVTDQYLYKNSTGGTLDYGSMPASGATQIKDLYLEGALTVNQIGTNAIASTAITTKVINATDSLMINGKQFNINEVTTLTGGGTLNISDANAAITAYKATGDDALVKKSDVDTAISTKANTADVYTKTEADGKFALQTNVNSIDGRVTAVETKTQDIKYETDGSTTVDGVNFNGGAVTGVNSINGNIKISADGKTVTFNEGVQNGQVQISENGIKVGTGSTYVSGDAVYTGGATYDNAKAGMKNDGSLKAANGNFVVDGASGKATFGDATNNVEIDDGAITATGDIKGKDITATGALSGATLSTTGDATVGGKLTVTGKTTLNDELEVAKGLSAANGEFVVNGTTGDTTIKGQLFAGANGTEFKVDSNGAITANSIQTGATSNNSIGGITLNNGALEAKTLNVTDTLTAANFNVKNLKVDNTLTVGTNTKLQDGTLTLGTDTQQQLTAAQLKNINSVVKDNGVIEAADGSKVGNVTFNNGAISGVTTITATGNISTTADISGKDITASGTVKGAKITDGTASLENGALTGATSVTVGNTTINTGGVTTNSITVNGAYPTTIDGNNGVVSAKGEIGSVKFTGAGAMTDVTSIDGVAVAAGSGTTGGLTIGTGGSAVTLGATDTPISTANFKVTNAGDVSGNTYVTNNGTTKLSDNSLHLDNDNYWNTTDGIKATQATIGANTLNADGISTTGKLDVSGEASFGTDAANQTKVTQGTVKVTQNGTTTTIEGGKISTDELTVKNIKLKGKMYDGTTGDVLDIGSDGHITAASGAFKVDEKGQVTNEYTGTDADGKTTKTTFKTSADGITANYTNSENDNNNLLNIDKNGVGLGVTDTTGKNLGMFSANATSASIGFGADNSVVIDAKTITSKLGSDVTSVMTNDGNEQSIVDKVGTASRTLKADSIVDSVDGKTITTNAKGTTFANGTGAFTTINGSSVRSYDPKTGAGHLNGATLNLYKNNDNATYMTAGGAEFIGDAGEKGGKKTTIKGGTITTDTLNVERINLGGEVIDKGAAGVEDNSKLYMDAQGTFRAATGNFTVKGGTSTDRGAMHNAVGNTTFDTSETGASMSYAGTVTNPDGTSTNVTSEVSVGNDSAKMSSRASSIEVKNDGITNTGKTTFKGTSGETTIDGGTIKTGHLITDKLTITGSGEAAGAGSGTIALGGDGSIKSNIKEREKDSAGNYTGNYTDKEATFETEYEHIKSEVKDGTYTATNEVKANKIGSVITGGTVDISQTLDAETGKITNTAGATSTELSNDGFAVKQNGYTDVNIANGDVSVTNKQTGKQVNLSDLGSLGDLNEEITSREEYTSNKTAVGAINAEAGIRREEVARLDGRINDVNDRVNKVGAMAAAIASLKSIGYDPQAPSEFSIGLGQYKGETGVAMGFFHYPNKNFMINVSLSTAGGETMGGIGATWRFGHKSPQKLLEEQRAEQAKKELAAAEKYQAAAKLAKEAQERAEYAAKLARQAQVSADNAKAAADATQAKHF